MQRDHTSIIHMMGSKDDSVARLFGVLTIAYFANMSLYLVCIMSKDGIELVTVLLFSMPRARDAAKMLFAIAIEFATSLTHIPCVGEGAIPEVNHALSLVVTCSGLSSSKDMHIPAILDQFPNESMILER